MDAASLENLFSTLERWQPWAALGRCRESREDMFISGAAQNRLVEQVCTGCVVRRECLAYALDTGQEYGVWGATERTRRKLIKEHPDISNWRRVFGLPDAAESLSQSA